MKKKQRRVCKKYYQEIDAHAGRNLLEETLEQWRKTTCDNFPDEDLDFQCEYWDLGEDSLSFFKCVLFGAKTNQFYFMGLFYKDVGFRRSCNSSKPEVYEDKAKIQYSKRVKIKPEEAKTRATGNIIVTNLFKKFSYQSGQPKNVQQGELS